MEKKDAIQIFEDKKVRTLWDIENEQWYFSIVDVMQYLQTKMIIKVQEITGKY